MWGVFGINGEDYFSYSSYETREEAEAVCAELNVNGVSEFFIGEFLDMETQT